MTTTDVHRPEPSTDFPTLEEFRPCPDPWVARLLLIGVAAASAMVGAVIGFLVGRAL
jgi:hypothetical protein